MRQTLRSFHVAFPEALAAAVALGVYAIVVATSRPSFGLPVDAALWLPRVNAVFNALSAVCLAMGYRAARRRAFEQHRGWMLGALLASTFFLVGYLARVARFGTHRFQGEAAVKLAYQILLMTHMVLAVVMLPLILRALFLASRKRFAEHRQVVRWAWPIWMYVSVTGVAVYAALYHIGPALQVARGA